MLTSEAELAADTKTDKDGKDMRFKQQGQHRKEHKKGHLECLQISLFQYEQNQNFKTCFV